MQMTISIHQPILLSDQTSQFIHPMLDRQPSGSHYTNRLYHGTSTPVPVIPESHCLTPNVNQDANEDDDDDDTHSPAKVTRQSIRPMPKRQSCGSQLTNPVHNQADLDNTFRSVHENLVLETNFVQDEDDDNYSLSNGTVRSTPQSFLREPNRRPSSSQLTTPLNRHSKPDVKLISLVMDMKAQLDTVVYHQQATLQELTKTRIENTPQLPTGILLPLQTFEQIQSLERKLQASSAEKQGLTAYLGLRGGKDVGTTTRKIMRTLMTNSLARCFNFVGHGAKHAYSALLLREVVNDAVRRNPQTKNATDSDVEEVIKDWLRTASSRSGVKFGSKSSHVITETVNHRKNRLGMVEQSDDSD